MEETVIGSKKCPTLKEINDTVKSRFNERLQLEYSKVSIYSFGPILLQTR